MKKNLIQKMLLVSFALSILVVSTSLVVTQNSKAHAYFFKAPLGTTIYTEYFNTTTYEDAVATTATGWGDGALSTTRDFTVSYLSTYSTSSFRVNDIVVQGRKAYIAVYRMDGLSNRAARTINVTDPTAMALMGWRDIADSVQSVAIHGDMLYVGREGYVIQYNVSNPYGPFINQGALIVTGNVTDLAVQGHFLHAVTRTTSGSDYQYIFDIQDPTSMNLVYSNGAWSDLYGLDVQGELLYLADGTYGIYVRNVSNPYAPIAVDYIETPGVAHDVLVDGGLAYVADGPAGVTILDVSDPTTLAVLGNIDTDGSAIKLALQGNTLFVSDSTGGVKIIDVTNPQQPTFIYQVPGGPSYGITVYGEILYVGRATGMDAYKVTMASVAGPGLPWFNRYNAYDAYDVALQGNIAYVAGGADGFYTLDFTNPRNPVLLDRIQHTGTVNYYCVEVQGGYAYIEDLFNGRWLSFSVEDPTDIKYLDWVSFNQGFDFVISGDVLYVADGTLGLYLMNISDPYNLGPNIGPFYTDGYNYTSIWVQGHTVYATATGPTSGNRGIFIYDASDLSNLVLTDHVSLTYPRDVVVYGDFMAVADGEYGVYCYNVTDPFNFYQTDYFDPNQNETYGVDMYGTRIVMAVKAGGVYLVDAADIGNLQMIASYTPAGIKAHRVTVHDEFAFVANVDSLEIFQLFNTAANSFNTAASTAQSIALDATTEWIVNATLTTTSWAPPDTTIEWYMTANGVNWEAVTPGVLHVFANPGSDFRWRAVLDTTYADQSPYIYDVSITYGYAPAPIITPPPIPGFPLEAIIIGAFIALSLGMLYRRKRQ